MIEIDANRMGRTMQTERKLYPLTITGKSEARVSHERTVLHF